MDYCKHAGKDCGQPAADNYCRVRYGDDAVASSFGRADDVGTQTATINLGDVPQIDHGVWGVNSNSLVYRWTGSSWEQILGTLKQVSVGNDGTVWGVNTYGIVVRRTGSTWTAVGGTMNRIAVGSAKHIWGVLSGKVYRWSGTAWVLVTGYLNQISVGSDGTVWGVQPDGTIRRYTGTTWQSYGTGFKDVSVGSSQHVWALDVNGNIFKLNGSTWTKIPGALAQISAGNDGSAWGVSPTGKVYQWVGDGWLNRPGTLTYIAHDRLNITPKLCNTATCDSFTHVNCTVTTLPETFDKPSIDGVRLDWCLDSGSNCGQPAAAEFCRTHLGFDATVASYEKAADIGATGPTKAIGDGSACTGPTCDGFSSITCRGALLFDGGIQSMDFDDDRDGVRSQYDNCLQVQNGPMAGDDDQRNSDWQGHGDACE